MAESYAFMSKSCCDAIQEASELREHQRIIGAIENLELPDELVSFR